MDGGAGLNLGGASSGSNNTPGLLDMFLQAQQATTPAAYSFGPPYSPQGTFTGNPLTPAPGALDYGGQTSTPLGGGGGGQMFTPSMTGSPEGGLNYPSNWQNFLGNQTTGGGFFSINNLDRQRFAQQNPPRQMLGAGNGAAVAPQYTPGLPDWMSMGGDLPSTNNYRLLPQQYQNPNFVMRNGMIIDLARGRAGLPAGYINPGTAGDQIGNSFAGEYRPAQGGPGPFVVGQTWPRAARTFYWPGGQAVGTQNVNAPGD